MNARTEFALDRAGALPPIAWLALPLLALWPTWSWMAARLADGSDEPWGLVSLAALAVLVWRDRDSFARAPRPGWLVASGVLVLALAIRHDSAQPPHELLSPREYQVFTLIAAGKTLTQAAEALSLSLNTVSTYRSRIMEKIGTQNDVETALYAVRHHLVNMSAA